MKAADRRRLVRLARAAATHTLDQVAGVGATSPESLRRCLDGLPARGRCAAVVAERAAGWGLDRFGPGSQVARLCPPGAVRANPGARVWRAAGWYPTPQRGQGVPRARLVGDPVSAAANFTSLVMLAHLSSHANSDVRFSVALNPMCPPAVLNRLAHDPVPRVRCGVAATQSCPLGLLDVLAGDGHGMVRCAAASNPDCPLETLQRCVTDDDIAVVEQAVSHPAMTVEALRAAVETANDYRCERVAGVDGCPPRVLAELASHGDWEVRVAVASNHLCPTVTLVDLVADHDSDVVSAALLNIPAETLEIALAAGGSAMRAGVAASSACPPSVLAVLARDNNPEIRTAVAENLSCGWDVLETLVEDDDPAVRAVAREMLN